LVDENIGRTKRNKKEWRHIMIFVCYPKCTTCQKAKKWLEANGIVFEEEI